MLYSVLAVGDVVGEAGLAHLERHLRPLQKLKHISFTVVNGENISGVGLTCKQAWRVYDAGADAVTLGNHTFGKMEICRMLDETPWLLRPANPVSYTHLDVYKRQAQSCSRPMPQELLWASIPAHMRLAWAA